MSPSITLRQAHKLVEKINAKIRSIGISPVASVNIWETEDVNQALCKLVETFNTNLVRVQDLTTIKNNVRHEIQVRNEQSGITATIAKRKALLDAFGIVDSLSSTVSSSSDQVTSAAALARKINSVRSQDVANAYRTHDTVAVLLITPLHKQELSNQVEQLKKQIEELDDKLLNLNTTSKAVINERDEEVLKKEHLL